MQLHKYFTRRTSLISLTIVLASAVSALSFTAQPSALHFGNLAATQTAKPTVDPASLITEFEVNGLKVLVKKRASSQTVAAGLFIRGGSRNITAENAGIEELMLDLSSEASANIHERKCEASWPAWALRSAPAQTTITPSCRWLAHEAILIIPGIFLLT